MIICFQGSQGLACKPFQTGDYNVCCVYNQERGILHHVLRKPMAGLHARLCHQQKRRALYSRNSFLFHSLCILLKNTIIWFAFLDRVILCSSGWLGTHIIWIRLASDLPTWASRVLGLKMLTWSSYEPSPYEKLIYRDDIKIESKNLNAENYDLLAICFGVVLKIYLFYV